MRFAGFSLLQSASCKSHRHLSHPPVGGSELGFRVVLIKSQSGSPLAVQFDDGGRVIYTTFHNEHQLTVDMELLLTEIIFKL